MYDYCRQSTRTKYELGADMSTSSAITATSAATIAATKSKRPAATVTMRAVTQRRYAPADSLTVEQVPRPEIGAEDVLIKVVAAGVDRGTHHVMTGTPYLIRLAGFGLFRPKNPIIGFDVAGRVVDVGSSVTRFTPGDEVMGIARGSFAEYAAAPEDKLVLKPANIGFDEAAAATISGITALQALTTKGELEAGERVLVIGASGGVGSFAVQIAAALGATVTAVASTDKVDFVRSLGADHVIDYTATDLGEIDETFDLIIDIGGRNPIAKLRQVLTSMGRLVIVGGEGGGRITGGIGRQLRATMLSAFVKQRLGFFVSDESLRHIEPLAELLTSKEVVPAIGSRFDLEDAPSAIRALEAGRLCGKAALAVRQARLEPSRIEAQPLSTSLARRSSGRQ